MFHGEGIWLSGDDMGIGIRNSPIKNVNLFQIRQLRRPVELTLLTSSQRPEPSTKIAVLL